jgi:hypothetical protein
MISIVLYGRNDSYGYNLHKRAALSFNCMAELLTDDDDEIIFVDYNTADDYPTFPESIRDTLTKQARRRLRILRVRPRVHERFRAKTRLVALEPISRNIAVLRSNPASRWILSTNTDMIFVLKGPDSLNDAVQKLPKGFYHAPRIEIPETLWEGLDRLDPGRAIETIRAWGWDLHLNEFVKGAETILYDGPGDFQLIERTDLFDMNGFDEDMLLGWHVDSNIAKRLYLRYGRVGDLGGSVFGYHCDHTRQITPAHSHSRTMNDWKRFIRDVTEPVLADQKNLWGCPGDEIEEIRLREDPSAVYISSLHKAIGSPLETVPEVSYADGFYNHIDYDPRHLLPFLADLFVCLPKSTNVAWTGGRSETLRLFAQVWTSLGFTGRILVDEGQVRDGALISVDAAHLVDLETILRDADLFVFDFGNPNMNTSQSEDMTLPTSLQDALGRILFRAITAEHDRFRQGDPLRHLIAVNAICNDYENIFTELVAAGLTPFSTRMRHGYAFPPVSGAQNWTPFLRVGAHGKVVDEGIAISGDAIGNVAYGPHKHLLPGRYQFTFGITGQPRSPEFLADDIIGVVELRGRPYFIGGEPIRLRDLHAGSIKVEIEIDDELSARLDFAIDAVIRTVQPTDLTVTRLDCERIEQLGAIPAANDRSLWLGNWLPMMLTGSAGERVGDRVVSRPGQLGAVVFGPYWTLPQGDYEASIEIAIQGPAKGAKNASQWAVLTEIFIGSELAHNSLTSAADALQQGCKLGFVAPARPTAAAECPIQIRLFTNSPVPISISNISVRRRALGGIAPPNATPGLTLPYRALGGTLLIKAVARRLGSTIKARVRTALRLRL